MIGIDDYILTDSFVLQLKNFLRSRHYLRIIPTREHLFDDSVGQTLAEFQAHKRLRITDGSLNLETLRAIGKEMKPMPLKRLTTELKWSAMFNLELKRFFTLGGIWLTGTPDIQEKSLERFKKMIGSQRMAFVKIGIACTIWGDFINLTIAKNIDLAMARIGDNEDNISFSVYMSDILSGNEAVEYQLATTFQMNDGFGNVITKTPLQYGGAATLDKDESLTGNIQIFVHPTEAVNKADERMSSVLGMIKSSDHGPLYFTDDVIDAHEYGHAHEGISGGKVDSEAGRSKAIRMENAVRARHPELGTRRRIEE